MQDALIYGGIGLNVVGALYLIIAIIGCVIG